jgi:Protein of unknown function (DUF1579)
VQLHGTRQRKREGGDNDTAFQGGDMRQRIVGFGFWFAAMIGTALAQTPAASQPGPEHKLMGYFEGKWMVDGEMKAGPMGPGGKVITTDTCEWFTGGFQLVCHTEGKSPRGPLSSMGFMSYDATDKSYKWYSINNRGASTLSKVTKSGKTWTFASTANESGQTTRFIVVEVSPSSYTFKWETSSDGTNWSTILEGKGTKASS